MRKFLKFFRVVKKIVEYFVLNEMKCLCVSLNVICLIYVNENW